MISFKQAKVAVKRYGTPLYLYEKAVMRARYEGLLSAIQYPHKKIYFACKANSHPTLLSLLKKWGCSIETVSPGEIEKAFKSGFKPSDISFTCSNISQQELRFVARQGLRVHLDSLSQLTWWGEEKLGPAVSLRLNTGFGAGQHHHIVTGGAQSKFGIYKTDIPRAKKIAKHFGLKVCGLHQHIGSNILDEKILLQGVQTLVSFAKNFPDLQRIDIGGGLGVPYHPHEKPFPVKKFGAALTQIFQELSQHFDRAIEMSLEPGRYLVAEAGSLLVQVTDIKKTPHHCFVGVNSGMNHLIRHALYGAYNHVINLSRPQAPRKKVWVVGNICESGDILAKQLIPLPQIGDFLLLRDVGAYGYAMSSDYNSRPKALEVVI